jgi:spore maturation protein CgeB
MENKLKIAFYGSSLVSAYWNGAATYYRGIIKELNRLGHQITFYEPDAYERQQHRDLEDPNWAQVVVYDNSLESALEVLAEAAKADVVIKASGVGVFDELLEEQVLKNRKENQLVIFWDVDAPATLERMANNPLDPFRSLVPQYDMILTYGGGQPVIDAYTDFGARRCIPIYNALDPETHFSVAEEARFSCDLAFLGNRLPDREMRVEDFFLAAAARLPDKRFKIGGSGWGDKEMPANVEYIGHVYTKDHNAFNCTPKAVLNISRDSMAKMGFSPATRVFEAAGAGACIITDFWLGIDFFFEPGKEILVANDGLEVARLLSTLSEEEAKEIGRAAQQRVLALHTYAHRAKEVDRLFAKHFQLINSTSL